jgi:hypothetical protein
MEDYSKKRLYVSEQSALFAADQMLKIYPTDEFKAIPVYREQSELESIRAEKAELIEALESILEVDESENLDLTQTVDLMTKIATQTLAKYETK